MIHTERLLKKFGHFTAVDNFTLDLQKGDICGLLGANGAGKTTVIRMLCGLLKPTSGMAIVNGFDIAHQAEKVKRSIGYMSQRFSLYEDLSVIENIRFYSGVYAQRGKELNERIEKYLDHYGLTDKVNSLTHEIPLGLKQRLALICAILHDPPVLFLDEPTSGVDPIIRREFWDQINYLATEGKTIIVSTHYMDEAEYCSKIVIMRDGKTVAEGSPKELKKMNTIESIEQLFFKLVDV